MSARFDLPKGRKARDAGEQLALLNDDEVWQRQYATWIEMWFNALPVGATFVGEALRREALRRGLPEPHHPNVWGGRAASFIRRWLADGRIVLDGIAQATSVKTHAHTYRQYRKARL